MEREGFLEFSLGCLTHVVRGSRRDNLVFPLILQVLDSTDCRSRVSSRSGRTNSHELRKIISVSDGFYSKVDCFLLTSNQLLEPYTIIKVHNVDFEYNIERQKDRPRIAGMILEFDILARGAEIGYFSGKPILLRDLGTHSRWGRGDNIIHTMDSLSSKLWKQVKEGRCCDVTFSFPECVGPNTSLVPTVKAQKNALIANSPVFEAQFEGDFSDASSEEVAILDTEPKYMRCLLQFIFTRFVPLLSLRQAFEVLYLARKYIIHDLETYCKNFIMNNKKSLAGVTDVFQYLEMNGKSCDDDISQFVWSQFRSCANVLIRQPRFLEIDFDTLENFLSESELNCHEWELVQAVRRWVLANNATVKCEEEDTETCAHQLVECIKWANMPIKECVMVQEWEELKLFHDRSFLTDIMEVQRARDGRNISHIEVVPACINKQYSLNRLYHDDINFVIYTTLTVDPLTLSVTCLHGQSAAQSTYQQTKCSTIGPPFELLSFYVVPSYGLSNMSNNRVRLTVNLTCQGKSFNADSYNLWVRSTVKLTVFSFSHEVPAKETRKDFNFWPDRDSSNYASLVFSNSELLHYLHVENGVQKLDLQLQFNTDMSTESGGDGRASPPKIMKPLRTSAPRLPPMRHRTTYDNRIDMGPDYREREASGVGRTVSFLRAGARRGGGWDGWGDVNRSPQSQDWSTRRSPDRDNTIEIQSPEYDQSDAYGNITRSPQSPGSHAGGADIWADHIWEEDQDQERRTSSPFQDVRVSRSPARSDSGWAPYRSPSPQPGPSHLLPRKTPRPSKYHLPWSPLPWSMTARHNPSADDNEDLMSCTSPPSSPSPPFSSAAVPFSPPSSPPRQRHSPVVLVKSFDSPEYNAPTSPASPSYEVPTSPSYSYSPPRSPSVIAIDLEDNEAIEDDLIGDSVQSNENQDGDKDVNNEGVVEYPTENCRDENQEEDILAISEDNSQVMCEAEDVVNVDNAGEDNENVNLNETQESEEEEKSAK